MKKILVAIAACGLLLAACIPGQGQPETEDVTECPAILDAESCIRIGFGLADGVEWMEDTVAVEDATEVDRVFDSMAARAEAFDACVAELYESR
jgi:hypothetical protein